MQRNGVFLSIDAIPYSEILQTKPDKKSDSLSYSQHGSPNRDSLSIMNENTNSPSSRNLMNKAVDSRMLLESKRLYRKFPSLRQLLVNPVIEVKYMICII